MNLTALILHIQLCCTYIYIYIVGWRMLALGSRVTVWNWFVSWVGEFDCKYFAAKRSNIISAVGLWRVLACLLPPILVDLLPADESTSVLASAYWLIFPWYQNINVVYVDVSPYGFAWGIASFEKPTPVFFSILDDGYQVLKFEFISLTISIGRGYGE